MPLPCSRCCCEFPRFLEDNRPVPTQASIGRANASVGLKLTDRERCQTDVGPVADLCRKAIAAAAIVETAARALTGGVQAVILGYERVDLLGRDDATPKLYGRYSNAAFLP